MTIVKVPQENIWEAYKNHSFWCQCHGEYPMAANVFFGEYELTAERYHQQGLDISDKALLDPLHGYNGEIDYEYLKRHG